MARQSSRREDSLPKAIRCHFAMQQSTQTMTRVRWMDLQGCDRQRGPCHSRVGRQGTRDAGM